MVGVTGGVDNRPRISGCRVLQTEVTPRPGPGRSPHPHPPPLPSQGTEYFITPSAMYLCGTLTQPPRRRQDADVVVTPPGIGAEIEDRCAVVTFAVRYRSPDTENPVKKTRENLRSKMRSRSIFSPGDSTEVKCILRDNNSNN